eukprot:333463_1
MFDLTGNELDFLIAATVLNILGTCIILCVHAVIGFGVGMAEDEQLSKQMLICDCIVLCNLIASIIFVSILWTTAVSSNMFWSFIIVPFGVNVSSILHLFYVCLKW